MASDAGKPSRIAGLDSDLERTRSRLTSDLSALRRKLTPSGLAEDVQARFQASSSPALSALGQRRQSWRSVARSSPVLTLLGAGLAWALLRSSRATEEV